MKKPFQKAMLLAAVSTTAFGMLVTSASAATASTNTSNSTPQSTMATPTPPSVKALSVILINADNGQILYQKDADERRAPASTTKLMTMLLVMKAIQDHKVSWSDEVPITKDAYAVATTADVSNAYLDPKEHFTLDDMMKFIAVLSANDATVAVGDKIGGDQDAFVQMMNQEAAQLGLKGTHYMNADGLPQDNHYTTARDLSTLARYLVNNYPDVLKYTSMPNITVRKGNTWPATDELLGHYSGVDGLKTGYTQDAGYCYVGTAKQNGARLISVVMADTKDNIEMRFQDTAKLFDFGFHNFAETVAAKKGEALKDTTAKVPNGSHTSLAVAPSSDLIVDLPNGVHGEIKVQTKNDLKAPIKKGDKVGTVSYVVGNQVISSTDLVAADDDKKANWFIRMLRSIGNAIGNLIHRL